MRMATPASAADQWESDLADLLGLDAAPAARAGSRTPPPARRANAGSLLLAAAVVTASTSAFLLLQRPAPPTVRAEAVVRPRVIQLRKPDMTPAHVTPPALRALDDAAAATEAPPVQLAVRAERPSRAVRPRGAAAGKTGASLHGAKSAPPADRADRRTASAGARHKERRVADESQLAYAMPVQRALAAPTPTQASTTTAPPSATVKDAAPSAAADRALPDRAAPKSAAPPPAPSSSSAQKVALASADVRKAGTGAPAGGTSGMNPRNKDKARKVDAIDAMRLLRRQ